MPHPDPLTLGTAGHIDHGKTALVAALEATLELHRDPARAAARIPVLRMASQPPAEVRARAERLAALIGGVVVATTARIGGGAVPLLELASPACSLEGGARLAARLRCSEPPVVGRVQEGRMLLDCTTLQDSDLPLIAAALAAP